MTLQTSSNKMIQYYGSTPYCYANSTSMWIEAVTGQQVSPSIIEVLSGVSMGAVFYEKCNTFYFSQILPDYGLGKALKLLGFEFEEHLWDEKFENSRIPLDKLREILKKPEGNPVVVGPLDMGHLIYNPEYMYLSGADHYVLAYDIDDENIYVHDPAGFPFASLPINNFLLAWKAEKIHDKLGAFRFWSDLKFPAGRDKVIPACDTYEKSIKYFKEGIMEEKQSNADFFGKEAILKLAQRLEEGRSEKITKLELDILKNFSFQLGARRALDYAIYFKQRPELQDLAEIKLRQAKLFGKCHSLMVISNTSENGNNELSKLVRELAQIEDEFKVSLLAK
eukprot:gene6145-7655_t